MEADETFFAVGMKRELMPGRRVVYHAFQK